MLLYFVVGSQDKRVQRLHSQGSRVIVRVFISLSLSLKIAICHPMTSSHRVELVLFDPKSIGSRPGTCPNDSTYRVSDSKVDILR